MEVIMHLKLFVITQKNNFCTSSLLTTTAILVALAHYYKDNELYLSETKVYGFHNYTLNLWRWLDTSDLNQSWKLFAF